ncbi:MAG: hypothetical protein IKG79_03615 [Neisseriaceae bacterium]|nr:hypothetical protein [Neisseriaceae bacterium]
MYKQEVIAYFGNQITIARKLGLTHTAIIRWKEIIPEIHAIKLERMTDGALKYDENLYKNRTQGKRLVKTA